MQQRMKPIEEADITDHNYLQSSPGNLNVTLANLRVCNSPAACPQCRNFDTNRQCLKILC